MTVFHDVVLASRPEPRPFELKSALRGVRHAFYSIGLCSAAINVLALTGSLFMLCWRSYLLMCGLKIGHRVNRTPESALRCCPATDRVLASYVTWPSTIVPSFRIWPLSDLT